MSTRAHPRSRGEHINKPTNRKAGKGSSPLARGTLARISSILCLSGLIPARAGNTNTGAEGIRVARAHPRSRGEHPTLWVFAMSQGGSSPLARGTQADQVVQASALGLIPARAGNTVCSTFSSHPLRAHPRSRGEHLLLLAVAPLLAGSSPLARGTRSLCLRQGCRTGLIPARAGNTLP